MFGSSVVSCRSVVWQERVSAVCCSRRNELLGFSEDSIDFFLPRRLQCLGFLCVSESVAFRTLGV